jgi:hypothetical protein
MVIKGNGVDHGIWTVSLHEDYSAYQKTIKE